MPGVESGARTAARPRGRRRRTRPAAVIGQGRPELAAEIYRRDGWGLLTGPTRPQRCQTARTTHEARSRSSLCGRPEVVTIRATSFLGLRALAAGQLHAGVIDQDGSIAAQPGTAKVEFQGSTD